MNKISKINSSLKKFKSFMVLGIVVLMLYNESILKKYHKILTNI